MRPLAVQHQHQASHRLRQQSPHCPVLVNSEVASHRMRPLAVQQRQRERRIQFRSLHFTVVNQVPCRVQAHWQTPQLLALHQLLHLRINLVLAPAWNHLQVQVRYPLEVHLARQALNRQLIHQSYQVHNPRCHHPNLHRHFQAINPA